MKVFLSHCTKDRELAYRIANDLKDNGIAVWFDEWEIFVGDSIIKKVQEGLNSCDFLSILFTKNSTESDWVGIEWQSILNKEITSRDIIVLPIKGDDCELPLILGDKLFADFSKDYKSGMNRLIESINYHHKRKYHLCDEKISLKKETSNEIEIKLPGDFEKFSDKDKEKFVKGLCEWLGISYNIRIISIRGGSIIVRLKFPDEKTVSDFFKKIKNWPNTNFEIEDAWLVDDSKSKIKLLQGNKVFNIECTPTTPSIYFNAIKGYGYIKGRFASEGVIDFFTPILIWFDDHLLYKSTIKKFELNCQIDYFNSSARKYLLDLFKMFAAVRAKGVDAKINWHYDKDDEDMLDEGKELSRMAKMPFEYIECEN
jgi:hypothetical protein